MPDRASVADDGAAKGEGSLRNLSDRDLAYDLLYGCKDAAQGYMLALMEAATPRCRDLFQRLHDDSLRDQWRIWQFLHQRNEYRVDQASRQEVESVRERMQQLTRTHSARMADIGGASWNQRGEANWGGRMDGGRGDANRMDGGRWDGTRTDGMRWDGRAADRANSSGSLTSETGRWGRRDDYQRGTADYAPVVGGRPSEESSAGFGAGRWSDEVGRQAQASTHRY